MMPPIGGAGEAKGGYRGYGLSSEVQPLVEDRIRLGIMRRTMVLSPHSFDLEIVQQMTRTVVWEARGYGLCG